jgi:hypothetical protein
MAEVVQTAQGNASPQIWLKDKQLNGGGLEGFGHEVYLPSGNDQGFAPPDTNSEKLRN